MHQPAGILSFCSKSGTDLLPGRLTQQFVGKLIELFYKLLVIFAGTWPAETSMDAPDFALPVDKYSGWEGQYFVKHGQ